MYGFKHRQRERRIASDRQRQFAAQIDLPLLLHEAALARISGLAQGVIEALTLELAGRAYEGRIVDDGLRNVALGHGEAQRAGALIEGGFRNQAREHHSVQAGGARLVVGDGAP